MTSVNIETTIRDGETLRMCKYFCIFSNLSLYKHCSNEVVERLYVFIKIIFKMCTSLLNKRHERCI